MPAHRLECSDASKRERLCYRVVDLDPEQEYEIQVAGHTDGGGWGEWSDPLSARTHEQNIPVLERELQVVDTKPTSITVKWQGLDQNQVFKTAPVFLSVFVSIRFFFDTSIGYEEILFFSHGYRSQIH
ncbi:unnamed protein product [Toxocara canis]|uniref:Fibronectin type-III domain-containing protein n=1 Tax=Toxocara canis TaxID=6265 RepID=A0A183U9L8_TOXCA|nr:unnamed protein product [Toxocara canis]VDM34447.1 unnamed protein product [Toxocara canis]